MITMWDGELHYSYGSPEVLERIEETYLLSLPNK